MLWWWSHNNPAVLPASGADALPRTTDFMHLDSALSRPDVHPRAMRGAAPLAAPRPTGCLLPAPRGKRCKYLGALRLTCFDERLPGEHERALALRPE